MNVISDSATRHLPPATARHRPRTVTHAAADDLQDTGACSVAQRARSRTHTRRHCCRSRRHARRHFVAYRLSSCPLPTWKLVDCHA